jgi:membrane-associated phospholipid phosphatase
MNIWQTLSISVFIFTYLPIVLAAFAKTSIEQQTHLTTLLGAIATIIISEGLKKTIFFPGVGGESPFARPAEARDCNAFCTDGPQGGAPGFPSTHSATTTFLALSYYSIYKSKLPFISTIIPIGWGFILYSRIALKCHTWLQIGAGALLGYGMYFAVN